MLKRTTFVLLALLLAGCGTAPVRPLAGAPQPTAVAAQGLGAGKMLQQVDAYLEAGKLDEAAGLLELMAGAMQVTRTSDLEDLADMCHRERQVAKQLMARNPAAGLKAANLAQRMLQKMAEGMTHFTRSPEKVDYYCVQAALDEAIDAVADHYDLPGLKDGDLNVGAAVSVMHNAQRLTFHPEDVEEFAVSLELAATRPELRANVVEAMRAFAATARQNGPAKPAGQK
jgi:hypothetical protein